MQTTHDIPDFPDPLRSWKGLLWIALAAVSGLFMFLYGCDPANTLAKEATKNPPTHLCHLEGDDWTTAGWVVGQRMYGPDRIMVLRTVHGCTCVLFLPDWIDRDGAGYPDGSGVTVRGVTIGGTDHLSRLYVFGINEAAQ